MSVKLRRKNKFYVTLYAQMDLPELTQAKLISRLD